MIIYNIITPKLISYIMPIIILLLIAIPLTGIVYYMNNTKLVITKESLIIKTLFYGKKIPIRKINVNELRKLNLYNTPEYNIKGKTNGIRMPGYSAGWMNLNNGSKALVHITDKRNVLLIPTDEYDILFSTNDFDGIKKILSEINK